MVGINELLLICKYSNIRNKYLLWEGSRELWEPRWTFLKLYYCHFELFRNFLYNKFGS